MNPHDPKDPAAIARMAADPAVQQAARTLFRESVRHRYSYNFTWLGRPIIQYPQDIVALQEIVWRVRPEVIVETGIAHGGSLILSASLLELLGGEREVIGVDIDIRPHNRVEIEAHPLARRITMIEGSSIDPSVVEQVRARVAGRPAMVVLDSNHTHEHVLSELRLYSPLVRSGSYLAVFDTVIEDLPAELYPDRPWGPGDSPKSAVRQFLEETDRFEVDAEMDGKLLLTVAPEGFLRCVRD
jgi:cephalosporin hydroxylase